MKKIIRNSTIEFLIFSKENNQQNIEVRYEEDTIWLTQKLIAELFDVEVNTINYHLKEIFKSGELDENSVIRKIRITAKDGKEYNTKHYNLDVIISVGYRVNSIRATQFRQWATQILKDFAIRGYLIDKVRMENGKFLNEDYFEKLLEEIREIRLSERRFYQKITDIYSTSIDYNKDALTTKEFFAKVQNKLHYGIHGNTAAEMIYIRADSSKANMGLTSWKNSPDGKILKSDVNVGKNYLEKDELESLGRVVSAYLDLAEERAKRRIPMTMEDWVKRLDSFLEFDEREILRDSGKVSFEMAKEKAENEFEKFRKIQDENYNNDFDKLLENSKDSRTTP